MISNRIDTRLCAATFLVAAPEQNKHRLQAKQSHEEPTGIGHRTTLPRKDVDNVIHV